MEPIERPVEANNILVYPANINAAVAEVNTHSPFKSDPDFPGYSPVYWDEITQESREAARLLPDLATSEGLHELGIVTLDAEMNIDATSSFRKENTGKPEPDKYPIVQMVDGLLLLLKRIANDNYIQGFEDDKELATLNRLYKLREAQSEVFSARIGAIISYPLADTNLVEYNGDPWLAYAFVPNAVDWDNAYGSHGTGWVESNGPIHNVDDLRNRVLFNMLVNATGDECNQGIVDGAGLYYANDVGMDSLTVASQADSDTRELSQILAQEYIAGEFDVKHAEKLSAESMAIFMEGVSNLTADVLEEVFADYLGSPEDKKRLVEGIRKRATALQILYAQGFFEAQVKYD